MLHSIKAGVPLESHGLYAHTNRHIKPRNSPYAIRNARPLRCLQDRVVLTTFHIGAQSTWTGINVVFSTPAPAWASASTYRRMHLWTGMYAFKWHRSSLTFTSDDLALVRPSNFYNYYDSLRYCCRTGSTVYTTCVDAEFWMG